MATREVANGTQSVDRAADLLARVVRAEEAITFTELCADSGYARSTTSRLLSALERAGLIGRDPAGAWVPGALFDLYAGRLDDDARLAELALSDMEALGMVTGETINLAVPRRGGIVQIAQVDSTYILGSRDWVDVEVPGHTSALGKVLYAHGAIEVPRGPLEQLTSATVETGEQLEKQLNGIRRKGFAVTVDEVEIGLTGIAAPVVVDGKVVAALGLSGPTSRLAATLSATGQVVATHARALSTRLGRNRKEGAA